jgi:hypothetical protein
MTAFVPNWTCIDLILLWRHEINIKSPWLIPCVTHRNLILKLLCRSKLLILLAPPIYYDRINNDLQCVADIRNDPLRECKWHRNNVFAMRTWLMCAATQGMTRNPDSPNAPPSCSTTATNTGNVFYRNKKKAS